MIIGITGDMHGDKKLIKFKQAKEYELSHLIVLGDFGYIWYDDKEEHSLLDKINDMNIEILFVLGNHENYTAINKYPIEERYGGKARKIRDNIYCLLNGEIYLLDNKTFFVMGGANSTDKEYRIKDKSWWEEEVPDKETIEYGKDNLKIRDNKVDCILTHTCYPEALSYVGGEYRADEYSKELEWFKDNIDYKYWFFGHMHFDYNIKCLNTVCVYNDIIDLQKKIRVK